LVKRIQNHEELYSLYLKSVSDFMQSIKAKQKDLSDRNDDDDVTKLHYTIRLMQSWFRSMGGLPIPE
jgi:hypothetical protein